MLNYWWVTRPKRKLNSVPEVLASIAAISLNQAWNGERGTHLSVEEALEDAGLKRQGDRRDHTGGGARTYYAWIESLGLIFTHTDGQTKLTLAGEAILEGHSPVAVLTHQVLKYQFPSAFSISRGVDVNRRFKIRPFRFLLTLLLEPRLGEYITQEEITKIVITEAENETAACYEQVVSRILQYRGEGDSCLCLDFPERYKSSKGAPNYAKPYAHLGDIANTIINWLEYTQFINRESQSISILEEKKEEVRHLVSQPLPFIDRPEQEDFFQRKFGCTPWKVKDTRNLSATQTITAQIIADKSVQRAFLALSLKEPIAQINASVIDRIVDATGIPPDHVESTLQRLYPHGAVNAFMTEYFEMAFKGTEEATAFEKATVEILKTVFGFKAYHVGPIGLTPDSLLLCDDEGFAGIIDNKAYSKYSISNDHHNRMCVNYIPNYQSLAPEARNYPLAFFSYIAGGFISTINNQLNSITTETRVSGSAITVSTFMKMIEKQQSSAYSHARFKELFSINRQILLGDI
jgi:hypothetical protein